jgi:hypothetical protein
MEMTLRKAAALQLAINEQIQQTEMPVTVTVTRYVNPAEVTDKGRKKFIAGLAKKRDLLGALYSIRNRVAGASEKAGVSTLLAKIAHADKLIGILTSLAAVKDFEMTDTQLLAAQDDLKRDSTADARLSYMRRDQFEASLISEAAVTAFKDEIANLKKEKQELSDLLLTANVTSKISLSEQEESILMKYGIL